METITKYELYAELYDLQCNILYYELYNSECTHIVKSGLYTNRIIHKLFHVFHC